VSFAVGGGGVNEVITSIEIWYGLYNSETEHYSNAVKCGAIGVQAVAGVISVQNLDQLKAAYHDAGEQGSLSYVFYATLDGGQVPYLVLNSTYTGPHAVPVTQTTASLSLVPGTINGWVVDLSKKAPGSNHPPRPMRSICYANGRLYGVLMGGGSGGAIGQVPIGGSTPRPDFTYVGNSYQEFAGVWWSAAAGDDRVADRLGDPLQCWPLLNFAPTPNGDVPLGVFPAPNEVDVLVLTARACFLLSEAGDGIHEYTKISDIHGLKRVETVAATRYGVAWVDQRNQSVLFDGQSLRILSLDYKALMKSSAARCADYLYDPDNEIDSYRVYLADGTCVVHDFALGGEAYSFTGQAYTAARTAADSQGRQHHIVAGTGVYTQEAQAETGLILTADETFTAGQAVASTRPTPLYVRNWDNVGDTTLRKDIERIDVTGDGDALSVEWYGDFVEVVDANKAIAQPLTPASAKAPQSETDRLYTWKLPQAIRFWHKFAVRLTPVSAGAPATFTPVESEGDQAVNFWGSVLAMFFHYRREENRG
jgi:hypothetical protein